MKGAGWCTIDAMMRFTREDYDKMLSRTKDAGINYMRAWGGGLVETDEFYDLCDEYGFYTIDGADGVISGTFIADGTGSH